LKFKVADRECDQVGRDRLRHAERKLAVQLSVRIVVGAHHGPQFGRRAHDCVVRDAYARRVLQRNKAACMNRLGLRVEEGVPLACGLLRFEPLQRQRIGGCLVADDDFGLIGGHLDCQWCAKVFRALANRKGGLHELIIVPRTNRLDDEPAGIEDQRLVVSVQPIQLQSCFTKEHLAVEVDREVEVDVRRAVVVGVRERVIVQPRHQARRNPRFRVRDLRLWLIGIGSGARGGQRQRRSQEQELPVVA
jgi:hypothetical protein